MSHHPLAHFLSITSKVSRSSTSSVPLFMEQFSIKGARLLMRLLCVFCFSIAVIALSLIVICLLMRFPSWHDELDDSCSEVEITLLHAYIISRRYVVGLIVLIQGRFKTFVNRKALIFIREVYCCTMLKFAR